MVFFVVFFIPQKENLGVIFCISEGLFQGICIKDSYRLFLVKELLLEESLKSYVLFTCAGQLR